MDVEFGFLRTLPLFTCIFYPHQLHNNMNTCTWLGIISCVQGNYYNEAVIECESSTPVPSSTLKLNMKLLHLTLYQCFPMQQPAGIQTIIIILCVCQVMKQIPAEFGGILPCVPCDHQ